MLGLHCPTGFLAVGSLAAAHRLQVSRLQQSWLLGWGTGSAVVAPASPSGSVVKNPVPMHESQEMQVRSLG